MFQDLGFRRGGEGHSAPDGLQCLFRTAQAEQGPGQGIHDEELVRSQTVGLLQQLQSVLQVLSLHGQTVPHIVQGLIVFGMAGDDAPHDLHGFIMFAEAVQEAAEGKGQLRAVRYKRHGLAGLVQCFVHGVHAGQQADLQQQQGLVAGMALLEAAHGGQGLLLLACIGEDLGFQALRPYGCGAGSGDPGQPAQGQLRVAALVTGDAGQHQENIGGHTGLVQHLLEQPLCLQVMTAFQEHADGCELEGRGVRALAEIFQGLFRLVETQ